MVKDKQYKMLITTQAVSNEPYKENRNKQKSNSLTRYQQPLFAVCTYLFSDNPSECVEKY